MLELINRPTQLPFGVAPEGTELKVNIVIGQRPDGSYALEQRTPSGVPFNPNDPAHVFGLFVVQNAQRLMVLAMEDRKAALAVQQTNEIIAQQTLQGA
jgi:hypothetical protein